MKAPIILRIFKEKKLIEVKQFESDQIIFGNEGEVHVSFADSSVSSIHCLIELRDSGYYISDLGSQSGTFKNEVQILDEPLSSGDRVGIGSYEVQFFLGAPKPTVLPPSPLQGAVAPAAVAAAPPPAPAAVAAAPSPAPAAVAAAPPPAPAIGVPNPTAEHPDLPSPQSELPLMAQQSPSATSRPTLPDKKEQKDHEIRRFSKGSKYFHTYAPKSEIQDLRKHLKPNKGPIVEVIVAWKERILSSQHFNSHVQSPQLILMGPSDKALVNIPSRLLMSDVAFLDLNSGCKISVPSSMQVELITQSGVMSSSEMLKSGKISLAHAGSYVLRLEQGEMARLMLETDLLQIFVRFVPHVQKPILAPSLDFTAGQLTGLIVSVMVVALFSLYMFLYAPPPVEEQNKEDELRLAQFVYTKKPTPPPVVEKVQPPPPEKEPQPPVPPNVPTPTPKVVKVDMEKSEKQKQKQPTEAAKQSAAKLAAEVRPKEQKNLPKKFTSTKQGGAVKMGNTEGANASSTRDVSKTGLLSSFGGGGIRSKLDQAYSGSGELLGLSDKATGSTGQADNRAGDDIGSKFKDTGAGGKGTATHGISNIGTKGRSSGQNTYGGLGSGGGKGSVTIDSGGMGEDFTGSIDREAVRKVIRSILGQIKSCYERRLRADPSLEGRIVIHFIIEEQGRVRTANTKTSTLNNPAVESCVAAEIKSQRFPEPPTGSVAEVDFPFLFGAQK